MILRRKLAIGLYALSLSILIVDLAFAIWGQFFSEGAVQSTPLLIPGISIVAGIFFFAAVAINHGKPLRENPYSTK